MSVQSARSEWWSSAIDGLHT